MLNRYKIDNIKLGFPFPQTGYEIHIAGRGMGVLSLIGELADGGLITPITPQYEQDVIQRILSKARTHNRDPSKINLETTLTYTSKSDAEFKTFAVKRIANVIKDTPLSILEAFRSTIGDSGMEKINLIQNTPSVEKAIPYVTEDIASLYYDVTNNPETVMRIAKQQANKGYLTMHFVIPPGEEKEVVSQLSQDLVEQIGWDLNEVSGFSDILLRYLTKKPSLVLRLILSNFLYILLINMKNIFLSTSLRVS